MATHEEYEKMSAAEKKKEDWMNSKWRPAMGWLYMGVCAFDFVIFPILWSLVQAMHGGQVTNQWQPLTLQGAGLFHIAMGAVLGLAAYGRTQEKVAGANNGGLQMPSGPVGTTYTPPAPSAPIQSFSAPKSTPSFGGSAPAPVSMSASGKPMPNLVDDREL
jgi:hypothetical protein